VIEFYLLLSITATSGGAFIFYRRIQAYSCIALLPLLLTLSEGVFEPENRDLVHWINLTLHTVVAAYVCIAALPRRKYRRSALRLFGIGCLLVLICLFFFVFAGFNIVFLQASFHFVAVVCALFFFLEWIRPPFESEPLKRISFWAVGAVFSYHLLRLAILVLPMIGQGLEIGVGGFNAYSADLAASSFYGLLLLTGALISRKSDFKKKS
jgi:hypothetical protein